MSGAAGAGEQTQLSLAELDRSTAIAFLSGTTAAIGTDLILELLIGSDPVVGLLVRITLGALAGITAVDVARRWTGADSLAMDRSRSGLAVGAIALAALVGFIGLAPSLGATPSAVLSAWAVTSIPYGVLVAGAAVMFTQASAADEDEAPKGTDATARTATGSEQAHQRTTDRSSDYSLASKASLLQRELVSDLNEDRAKDPAALLKKFEHLQEITDEAQQSGEQRLARRMEKFLDSMRPDLAEAFLDRGSTRYRSAMKARKRGELDEFRRFLERAETQARQGLALVNPVEAQEEHEELTELLDLVQTLQDDVVQTRDLDELKASVDQFLDEAREALKLANRARQTSDPDRAQEEADRAERSSQRAAKVAGAALELAAETEDTGLTHEFENAREAAEELERKAERVSIGGPVVPPDEDDHEDQVRAALKATGKVSTIEREFASGGFGRTFLAHDELDRTVVVKTLREGWKDSDLMRDSFRNEASLESGRHPNLVHVDAYFEKKGFPFKIMEYVEGGGLDDLLDQAGRLDPDRSLSIIEDVCEALSWVNRDADSEVVHRDIKPANILLARDGTAKLTDFGLAKLDRDEMEDSLAASGQQPGTLHYMSPEQARGDAPITPRSDQFSIGVVLYEVITGEHPFRGDEASSDFAIKRRIAEASVPLGHEAIPPSLRDLLGTLLAKNPEDRFEDFDAALKAFREARAELTERQSSPAPERFDHLSRYVDDPDTLDPRNEEDVSFLISRIPAADDDEQDEVARDLDSVLHGWIHDGAREETEDRTEYVVEEYGELLQEACRDEDVEQAHLIAERLLPLLQEQAPEAASRLEEIMEPLEIAVEEDDASWVDWARLQVVADRIFPARDSASDDEPDREGDLI